MFSRRTPERTCQQGLTIVELMLVVGIISVMTTLALQSFKSFRLDGMRSEAKLNLNTFRAVVESYSVEHNLPTSVGHVNSHSQGGQDHFLAAVSPNGCPGGNSCNCQNPFDFELLNCEDTRWGYNYRNPTGNGYILYAFAQYSLAPCGQSMDRMARLDDGEFCHYQQQEALNSCTTNFNASCWPP